MRRNTRCFCSDNITRLLDAHWRALKPISIQEKLDKKVTITGRPAPGLKRIQDSSSSQKRVDAISSFLSALEVVPADDTLEQPRKRPKFRKHDIQNAAFNTHQGASVVEGINSQNHEEQTQREGKAIAVETEALLQLPKFNVEEFFSYNENVDDFGVPGLQLESPEEELSDESDDISKQTTRLTRIVSFVERLKSGEVWQHQQIQNVGSQAFSPRNRAAKERKATLTEKGPLKMLHVLNHASAGIVSASLLRNLLKSLSAPDVIDGAIKVLDGTKDTGFIPPAVTYTCLVCLYLKTGDHFKATQLLDELLLMENQLEKSTFVTLIYAFERAGRGEILHLLLTKMLECNCELDTDFTSKVLNQLAKENRLQESFSICEKIMEKKACVVEVKCCNLLIDCFGKASKIDIARELLLMMKKGLCKPDLSSYNILMSYLAKEKRILETCELFDMLKEDEIEPDGTSYRIIIRMLGDDKKAEYAFEYFREFRKRFGEADTVTYACMITAFGKSKDVKSALGLYREMKRKGIAIDGILFNTVIHILGKAHKSRRACEVFDEMKERKCDPDLWTYNHLIDAMARDKQTHGALGLFEEMKWRGIVPDVVTYTVLIDGLGDGGEALLAYKLYEEMISKGYQPNIQTWNSLLNGLTKEDLVDLAFSVYEQMRKDGVCAPDKITFSLLLDLTTSLRDSKKAIKLQKDMKRCDVEADKSLKRIMARSMKFIDKETRCCFNREKKMYGKFI